MLLVIDVDYHGYRQVLGIKENAKKDKESWSAFMRYLKERDLAGVALFLSDKCMDFFESLADLYPDTKWQRCAFHFYRKVFTVVPKSKIKAVENVAAVVKNSIR